MRRLSPRGLKFLKREEGVVFTVYLDQKDLPTIGVGHLIFKTSVLAFMPMALPKDAPLYAERELARQKARVARLQMGRKAFPRALTMEEVDNLLRTDLARFEEAVSSIDPPESLTEYQFDALVSFAFNIGVDGFKKSTMAKHLLLADDALAAEEFGKWTNKRLPVLVGRRAREKKLFLTGDYGKIPA